MSGSQCVERSEYLDFQPSTGVGLFDAKRSGDEFEQAWETPEKNLEILLSGFSGGEELEGSTPGEALAGTKLARSRIATIKNKLTEAVCPNEQVPECFETAKCCESVDRRVREVAHGVFGEPVSGVRRTVDLKVVETRVFDTLAHEAGHMLGLGDEASDEYADAKQPVASAEYAATVRRLEGTRLIRADDDSIMSRGTEIRAWHYVPFQEVIEAMTCKYWRIAPTVGSDAAPPADSPATDAMKSMTESDPRAGSETGDAAIGGPPKASCVLPTRGDKNPSRPNG